MFTSEAMTRGEQVHVESEYAPERSQPSQNQWFFLYTITITNEGTETRAADDPPLDHHRRHRPDRGSPRPGRRRQAAGARAGRVVHLHVRLPARHAVRRDGRHLPDGHRATASSSTRGSRRSRSASPTPFTDVRATYRRALRRTRTSTASASSKQPQILAAAGISIAPNCARWPRHPLGVEQREAARAQALDQRDQRHLRGVGHAVEHRLAEERAARARRRRARRPARRPARSRPNARARARAARSSSR